MSAINCFSAGVGGAMTASVVNTENTLSWTPVAGTVPWLTVTSQRSAGAGNQPTVDGSAQGITWTNRGSVTVGNIRKTFFTGVVGAPAAGVSAISYGGQDQDIHGYEVGYFTGVNTANPVVQFASNTVLANTTYTITGAAFESGKPFNATFVGIACEVNSGALRTEVGYMTPAISSAQVIALPFRVTGLSSAYGFRPDNDTACIVTQGSSNGCGFLVELRQDGSNVNLLTASFEDSMIETRQADAVDQSIDIMIRSTTTGLPKTGLAFDTAGLTAHYTRAKAAAVDITLETLAAINSAHADGGFKEYNATKAKGKYRLDLPDAVLAAGVGRVRVDVVGSDCHGYIEIDLTADNPRAAAATSSEIATAAVAAWMAEDNGGLTNAELLAAGGSFNLSAPAGVLTVKDNSGATLFTRDLTRAVKDAITGIAP